MLSIFADLANGRILAERSSVPIRMKANGPMGRIGSVRNVHLSHTLDADRRQNTEEHWCGSVGIVATRQSLCATGRCTFVSPVMIATQPEFEQIRINAIMEVGMHDKKIVPCWNLSHAWESVVRCRSQNQWESLHIRTGRPLNASRSTRVDCVNHNRHKLAMRYNPGLTTSL